MFMACVEIFDQRRSEERNPTRPSARKPFPLLRTPPEGSSASSYKHATPNGVKPVTIFPSFCRWWDSFRSKASSGRLDLNKPPTFRGWDLKCSSLFPCLVSHCFCLYNISHHGCL